jgi:hypothetical protein
MCYPTLTGSTITWTPGGSLSDPTIADPISTPASSTNYIVSIDDGSGCLVDDTISVATDVLDVTITNGNPTICEGDALKVVTTSNISSATYAWTPATGVSDPAAADPIMTPTVTTTYTLTTTTAGCVDVDTMRVTVNPKPVVDAGQDTMRCALNIDSVGLSASGALTYAWTPGMGLDDSTSATPMAYPPGTLTYYVTGTSINGCSQTDSVVLHVNTPILMMPFAFRDPICAGDTTQLNAGLASPGLYNFTWTGTGVASPTSRQTQVTVPGTTTYTIFVDGTGACTGTDSVTVTTAPLDITVSSGSTICAGEFVTLTTTSNMSGVTYDWTPKSGIMGCSTCKNAEVRPSVTTTYTVTATSGACTDIETATITVNQSPNITISSDTTICSGSTVQLSASASGSPTYSWSPATGLDNASIASPSATVDASTIYYVEVTSGAGCVGKEQVTVNVSLNELTVMTDIDTLCPGESAQLDVVVCDQIFEQFNTELDYSLWSAVLGGEISDDCGAVTGTALYFNGSAGNRTGITKVLDLSGVRSVNFYLKYGSGNAPCNEVEPGQEVSFEYSIDGGIHWDTIQIYWDLSHFASFRQINEWLPTDARTATTMLRWRQLSHTGMNNDNWSLDDISFCVNNIGGITYSWSPTIGLSDPAIRNPISNTTQQINYVVEATQGSCNASDDITIFWMDSCVVGLGDYNFGGDLQVYPNPTDGSFRVRMTGLEGMVQLEILDVLGQVVHQDQVQSARQANFNVELSTDASGLFMVRIHNEGQTFVRRIMVQK